MIPHETRQALDAAALTIRRLQKFAAQLADGEEYIYVKFEGYGNELRIYSDGSVRQVRWAKKLTPETFCPHPERMKRNRIKEKARKERVAKKAREARAAKKAAKEAKKP
jgi:hypothetical protein